MHAVLLVALLCADVGTMQPSPVVTYVDKIELNHFYDQQGKHGFDQLIFWDWYPPDDDFRVRAWRLVKNTNMIPRYNYRTKIVYVRWHDGEYFREIRTTVLAQSWTQYDPEMMDREKLSRDLRKGLPEQCPVPIDFDSPPQPSLAGPLPEQQLPKPAPVPAQAPVQVPIPLPILLPAGRR